MEDDTDLYLAQEICEKYKRGSSHHTVKEVIKVLSGYDGVPFDKNNPNDVNLLEDLKRAA